jgi:hypothetical protein
LTWAAHCHTTIPVEFEEISAGRIPHQKQEVIDEECHALDPKIAGSSCSRALRGFVGGACAVPLALVVAIPVFAQQSPTVNPARITQVVDDSVLTTLRGNVHPLAKPQYDKGPADPSLPAERMQLVLKRSSGQEIALRQSLGSLQDTNSAHYRK